MNERIVIDPKICHGKPVIRGTRIMVFQVLRQVARGKSWDAIVADWRGSVSKEAIAEAIALAESIRKCLVNSSHSPRTTDGSGRCDLRARGVRGAAAPLAQRTSSA